MEEEKTKKLKMSLGELEEDYDDLISAVSVLQDSINETSGNRTHSGAINIIYKLMQDYNKKLDEIRESI